MRAFQIYGCTDVGAVRKINEDHILLGRFIKNHGGMGLYFAHSDDFVAGYGLLFAVADGIGGENAGEVASRFALTAFERQFYGVEKNSLEANEYKTALEASANRANETLLQLAASKPEWSGMGCTISGICITPFGYLVYNAGDSRVYRHRNGILKPLTNDDTITNLAVQSGGMSFEEAKGSRSRHTLTSSLGAPSCQVKIEHGPEIRDNDLILICSDGLHDMVSDEEMESIIDANETVEQIGKKLLSKAMDNGGHDNISIIVIRSDVFEDDIGWKPEGFSKEGEVCVVADKSKDSGDHEQPVTGSGENARSQKEPGVPRHSGTRELPVADEKPPEKHWIPDQARNDSGKGILTNPDEKQGGQQ